MRASSASRVSFVLRAGALAALALVGSGCMLSRGYRLPISAAEGQVLMPALAATAEQLGYLAHQSGDRLSVDLKDGARLWYTPSADNRGFGLAIIIPEQTPPQAQDERFREAKVKADQLWELAVEARQKNNVGATVLVPGPGMTAGPQGGVQVQPVPGGGQQLVFGNATMPAAAPPGGQRPCRYGTDCGPGQFCRDRGDGQHLCMGSGRAGDFCAWGTDCGAGLFCRNAVSGLKTCQP